MKSKNKSAFTLIELLVVIAIIGILATISVIALQNARAKSRDAKRAGDIKQVQTALELFFNDKNRYPTVEEWNTGKIFSTTSGSTSTYMQIIPSVPTPNDGSCSVNQNSISYTPASDWSSYSISFCLGNTTGSLTPGPKCLTPGGILDVDCSGGTPPLAFACGDQITITDIAGHTCDTGGPNYDTCTYDTVQIGTQCWMKQNMNIGQYVTGATTQTNDSNLQKYCYGDNTGNCPTDGGLYQWDEAMQYSTTEGAQGICPTGWHIPSDAEQNALDQYLTDPPNTCDANRYGYSDCANAGTKLQVGGGSGFEGLLAGFRDPNGSFGNQGTFAGFWSSTISVPDAWRRGLFAGDATVYRHHNDRAFGFSVRCLQD